MHYAHSHVITIRPPARTGAWSLAALARRMPDSLHGERELRAGFEGLELWIKELADPCESAQAFEALAHSPTLLTWHRDNARKVVQKALMRDLRAFHALHLGAELADAVLPRCEAAGEQAAVRVRHVRELAALLAAAGQAVERQGLSGEAALREALRLRDRLPGAGEPAANIEAVAEALDEEALVHCESFPRAPLGRQAAESALR